MGWGKKGVDEEENKALVGVAPKDNKLQDKHAHSFVLNTRVEMNASSLKNKR